MRALLRRLGDERGFTMIELQIVMVIMGILTTSAGPSMLGVVDQARKVAAAANVRAASPAIEAYYMDNNSYLGMDVSSGGVLGSGLESYDSGIQISVDTSQDGASSYCVYSKLGGFAFYRLGPGGEILEDSTPDTTPCAD